MTKTVTVTYDASNDKWEAENPIVVSKGITTIEWAIQLSDSSTGMISFGTEPSFQGIKFGPRWPGTHPKGNQTMWATTINDRLDDNEVKKYHYTVNALYQADELSPAMKKSWDPEVEEDTPPPPVNG
jgi:hypothetical protein